LAKILISVKFLPDNPSTFKRYLEVAPFSNLISGIVIALLDRLYTFKVCVVEPIFEKMVSKKMVSFENSNFPKFGTVLKSFLQELTTFIYEIFITDFS